MMQRWMLAFTAMCLGIGVIGAAQDRATVQLRDGAKFEGRIEKGRVGTSRPFGIGDQASVPMPFDGVLSLAVNDDERSDNSVRLPCRLAGFAASRVAN